MLVVSFTTRSTLLFPASHQPLRFSSQDCRVQPGKSVAGVIAVSEELSELWRVDVRWVCGDINGVQPGKSVAGVIAVSEELWRVDVRWVCGDINGDCKIRVLTMIALICNLSAYCTKIPVKR
ncbi:hypothetical protein Q3G72_012046 [Acer saccharum]|nr:hypothetical protein Q3G72_012046 [Acer saccharum]